MKELNNQDMSQFTSFRAGGKVRRFVIVDDVEELKAVLASESAEIKGAESRPTIFLGNGSNTLFASELYDGLVVKLGEGFDYIDIKDESDEDGRVTVTVGASTLLSRLAKSVGAAGLTGLEFAAGIPGSVGGAVFMNAGAYDGEIKNTLQGIKVFSPGMMSDPIKYIPADELDLSYRHSALMESGDIVLEAVFKLERGNKEEINAYMKELAERRSSKQPLEYPSAGSFFKRPPGNFAGKLIEDAGLKGFSVGGAEISEKHAGFIINKGGATSQDILGLMKAVQEKVKNEFGVELEPEIRIIT